MGGEAAEAAPRPPLRSLIASHRAALGRVRELCDGQHALLSSHEAASIYKGESGRALYLQQLSVLCQQQRLMAMQLDDAVRAELEATQARQ